ncbi:MAG: STAS domain-containing protein [Victivallaceae bacterium]|nr:STAS domain-containing protein [Victivallaceae bacterium]
MKITMNQETNKLTVSIEGSIDTVTAPELEKELAANWNGVTKLFLDFKAVDYISSAGLRVMMAAEQHMEAVGSMTIMNVNDDVKEVFEMTGFDELLNFE